MWLFVPIQEKLKEFVATIHDFPFQTGASLNAAGFGYNTLRTQDAMQRLRQVESFSVPVGR